MKPLSKDDKFIIELVKTEVFASTWWASDFYKEMCKRFNFDPNDFNGTRSKIRYKLNALVKKQILEKKRVGTGDCGKTDTGVTSMTNWALKGTFL